MLGNHPAECTCVVCQNQRSNPYAKADVLKEAAEAGLDAVMDAVVAALEGGASREVMVDRLVEAGGERKAATAFVDKVDTALRKARKDAARKSLLIGLVLVAVSVSTFAIAGDASSGRGYIVALVTFIIGIWKVVQSVRRLGWMR